jgi:tRNA dimethylallyltransferase
MERWSAARWAAHAADIIGKIGAHRVLVVGGTGLYLNALVSPLFDEPPTDPTRRAALSHELDAWPLATLRDWAKRLDPARAHLGRTQLIRSIEVALLSGERLSTLHKESGTAVRFRARWLVVDPGTPLQEQIAYRLATMLAAGWIDEARELDRTVDADAPAWQACGYAAIRAVARGEQALQDASPGILVQTRQYAKRQRTWFRHQLAGADVTRLDPRERSAAGTAEAWWRAEEAL